MQKTKDLLTSTRFLAALATVIMIVVQQWFPNVSSDMVTNIVYVVVAWIVSVAFRPTGAPPTPPVVVVPPATGVFPAP